MKTKHYFRLWPVLVLAIIISVAFVLSLTSRPSNGAGVTLQLVAQGFTAPIHLESSPDDTGRRFVVDSIGTVHILLPDGSVLARPFLDIRDKLVPLNAAFDERGLLGMTFHPDFADNGRVFVHYSAPLGAGAPRGWNHTGRVVEFTVSADDPNRVDHSSERLILTVDQPQNNHNGGTIAFGPDGYLYIGLGDGGGANDSGIGHAMIGNGQDVTTLLGKILRIDVDIAQVDAASADARAYGIPVDNPFVGDDGKSEIYAWGFRNPYRFSFDRGGQRLLYVADVGESLIEEVNVITEPGNFGWPIKEGSLDIAYAHPGVSVQGLSNPTERGADVTIQSGLTGIAVIGGYVYRGSDIPKWEGKYVFGDWSRSFRSAQGQIFLATPPNTPGASWTTERLMELNAYVLGFGEDANGELYVLTTDRTGPSGTTGKVYKIVASHD